MPKLSTLAVSAFGLAAAVAAPAGSAVAASSPMLSDGVFRSADAVQLQSTDFFWGGRDYCWYPDGWRGPGWYWCGYAFRYGWGWGGPWGWHGWRGGDFDRGRRFGGGDHWRGGGHWDGGHGGGHWGGGHGGGHWGGDHGGGHGGGHDHH